MTTPDALLREIAAQVPNPTFACYTTDRGYECSACEWCDAEWKRGEPHPANDCAWPKLQAALAQAPPAPVAEDALTDEVLEAAHAAGVEAFCQATLDSNNLADCDSARNTAMRRVLVDALTRAEASTKAT